MTTKPTYTELEQKIRDLEERVQDNWTRKAVDASSDAIGISTADGHHFFQNKSYDSMFGYTLEEMSRLHPSTLYESEHVADEIFETIMAGKSWRGETEMVAKNGRRFPVSIRADAIKDENGDVIGLIGVHTDITERKRTDEALRFEREQLLSIFDSIDEVIYVSDPDTYEVLYANKALKDALQKNPIGGICYREFQGFDAPCHFCTNDIILKQRYAPYNWEHHNPVVSRDYTIIDRIIKWPDDRDVRFELAINITERKQAEKALRESEERFRRFSAAAFEAIIIHEEGVLVSANDQYYEMFGYEPAELMGKQALPFTMAPEVIESTRKEIATGGLGPYESIGLKKDGTRFPIEIRVREWEYKGRVVRVAAIMDITERKHIEVELENHRKHLEDLVKRRTERLEVKNKELEIFTYSVSHDLKAPLRGIDGYSRLLMEDYADKFEDEGLLFLSNIRRSAEQMNQLIEDLLTYSRAERRQLQVVPIALRPMVEMLISQKSHDMEAGNIRISVNLPFDMITSDPETLRQVLDNYLDNAIKFMKKDALGAVEVGGRESQASWTLWVKDNGIGFDNQYHDRIFNVFQRLHRTEDYPGTGVGLALVRKAVERIEGRVWAESEVGKGSVFFISIPKRDANIE